MRLFKKRPTLILGAAITVVFLLAAVVRIGLVDALDLKFYDFMMGMRGEPDSPSSVVIVDIDDESIDKLGRWPWSRSVIASAIDVIHRGGPKAIGLNFIFSEPEESAGLKALTHLEAVFAQTIMPQLGDGGQAFASAMNHEREKLDGDGALAGSVKAAGSVILPVFFRTTLAEESQVPEAFLRSRSIGQVHNPESLPFPTANAITLPIPALVENAGGIGHINLAYDMDGTARRERLIYGYRDLCIPSYTLALVARFLDYSTDKIRVDMGSAVHLKHLTIPTTAYGEMMVNFKGPRGVFKRFSFFDVLNGKIPDTVFKDKIVLVSASAAGIVNPLSTPTDASMPIGEFSAHAIESILNERFIQKPLWRFPLELALIFAVGLFLVFGLPRWKAKTAGIAFWAALFVMVLGVGLSFGMHGIWISATYPMLQLVVGYIGVVSIQYFMTETTKDKVEGESAETNRMLGLSFQSQGMLDMAFDKFRRVPVDDQMKDILYNLALDYERKRQLNKAAAVFQYIEEHDPGFRDVGERKSKLMQASETMVFGDGFFGAASSDDLLAGTSTGTRPTLGRYEIVRQLGKGAMGVVYLGRDPRINRTTAIKTFRFSEDLDPTETEKLKQKFFREAESAGTLSHPNIVTIYDAGDEHDLAYIAMELLDGEDLEKYTRKDSMLPVRKVIDYMADVADALDYAHQRGIVHRDIKPANVMLLKSGVVKITDFGIARITATSQTQTGVVKGTPYYMSPEQFSGEKVDGRSDIFSLGTMTYQLLTGKLPFYGESPAALMHQILNVKQPDPRSHNPKIYKPLVAILDKALEKNREKRYQRASTLANHLRELGKKIDAATTRAKAPESRP